MAQLNRQQQMAARPDGGVNLVLAGAGTGKTSTLVEKVNNIITGLSLGPENILILTFSRKAAGEIRERVIERLGRGASALTAGTFHSFCYGFIRENREAFMRMTGYRDFPVVMDDITRDEGLSGILLCMVDEFRGVPVPVIRDLVQNPDLVKGETGEKLKAAGLLGPVGQAAGMFRDYKLRHGLIDYDDMIRHTVAMLKQDPQLRARLLSRYTYILADEFQDTAEDNFELINLMLPQRERNFFAVGDDWQSIYSFRKAKPEYIIRMKTYFPGARTHRLYVNYRSCSEITGLSNRFIKRNRQRTRKRLVSHRGRGGRVRFHRVADFEEEVLCISGILHEEMERTGNIAVLFRNNWQGRFLVERIDASLQDEARVSFMTIHRSKGLEFDSVIVSGVSDSIMPDPHSNLEEERRIMYVALTRARTSLHIVLHRNRDGTDPLFGRELR